MFPLTKKIGAGLLISYLSLVLAILPGRSEGALLESTQSSPLPSSQLLARLTRRGLNPEEAQFRLSTLSPTEIGELTSGSGIILRGSGVQYPYQNVANEVGYVFLILVVVIGLAGAAAYRASD